MADNALEACARAINNLCADLTGLQLCDDSDLVAVMRRYGLRGPNIRHVEEQPPTDWEDCCPNAGTRHCECWERTTQEERP